MNDLHDIQRLTVCMGMKLTFSTAARSGCYVQNFTRRFNVSTAEAVSSSERLQWPLEIEKKPSGWWMM